MLPFSLKTPQELRQELGQRVKSYRLTINLSQEGLARRAGISAGTIKRFEKSGHISVDSLLKIAFVLDAVKDFDNLFKPHPFLGKSIEEIIEVPKLPQRGRLK